MALGEEVVDATKEFNCQNYQHLLLATGNKSTASYRVTQRYAVLEGEAPSLIGALSPIAISGASGICTYRHL
jgi:hypothetical protein